MVHIRSLVCPYRGPYHRKVCGPDLKDILGERLQMSLETFSFLLQI